MAWFFFQPHLFFDPLPPKKKNKTKQNKTKTKQNKKCLYRHTEINLDWPEAEGASRIRCVIVDIKHSKSRWPEVYYDFVFVFLCLFVCLFFVLFCFALFVCWFVGLVGCFVLFCFCLFQICYLTVSGWSTTFIDTMQLFIDFHCV